jgi:HK97 family phage prohead protease
MKEIRTISGPVAVRAEGDKNVADGYAAVFNRLSLPMGGFREKIAPGAFAKSVAGGGVKALLEHDPRWLLGSTKSGTLKLLEDDRGLRAVIALPATSAGGDAAESLRRGDLGAMSIGFRTVRDSWDENKVRTLHEVELFDVSLVAFPAYPDTSVALRSLERWTTGRRGERPLAAPSGTLRRARLRLAELALSPPPPASEDKPRSYCYRETGAVPGATRYAAEDAAHRAARDLGLPTVRVVFFSDSGAGRVLHHGAEPVEGFVRRDEPGKIYINANLPADQAARAARHEAAHLAQFRDDTQGWDNETAERQAEEYARLATARAMPRW